MRLDGTLTALITPFCAEGIDIEGVRTLIDEQIAANISGLVILGTTGEAPTLTAEERRLVITTAVAQVKQRIPIIVGTTHNCTKTCLTLSLEAESLGADAVMIAMPYYNKPSQRGLIKHIESVACQLRIPIVLYNNPTRCSVNLEPTTALNLLARDDIIAIKEAGDLAQVMPLVKHCDEHNFTILAGDDAATLPMMALGGHGLVSVAANLIPKDMVTLTHFLQENNLKNARQQHYHLNPLFDILGLATNPISIKAAMQIAGKPSGSCRAPLDELASHIRPLLEEAIHPLMIRSKA